MLLAKSFYVKGLRLFVECVTLECPFRDVSRNLKHPLYRKPAAMTSNTAMGTPNAHRSGCDA